MKRWLKVEAMVMTIIISGCAGQYEFEKEVRVPGGLTVLSERFAKILRRMTA